MNGFSLAEQGALQLCFIRAMVAALGLGLLLCGLPHTACCWLRSVGLGHSRPAAKKRTTYLDVRVVKSGGGACLTWSGQVWSPRQPGWTAGRGGERGAGGSPPQAGGHQHLTLHQGAQVVTLGQTVAPWRYCVTLGQTLAPWRYCVPCWPLAPGRHVWKAPGKARLGHPRSSSEGGISLPF
jgi:hypothetical protein